MKKAALFLLKVCFPVALLTYLLASVPAEEYATFWSQPKRWDLLAAAQCLAVIAIIISFLRWYLLVRAFDIPFTVREALRLGFLGYLLNFVSFGSVGGDFFKAILVARDKPQRRPEAVASVLLDRAIGLLGLIILAWCSLLAVPSRELSEVLIAIRNGAGIVVAIAVVGLTVAVTTGAWFDRLLDRFEPIPLVGPTLTRMAKAVRRLKTRKGTLFLLITMACVVHCLLALTVFLISSAIYPQHPSLLEHLTVVPPGMAAGALPLAPGGLGLQEGALSQLFYQLPDLPEQFSGILVATVYRIVTILICGIGVIIYWFSHGKEFKFLRRLERKQA